MKINAIAHSIIAVTRPRSSLSYLQVGSKKLPQVLNSLGFCASYEEYRLLESSLVNAPHALKYDKNAYIQMVADKADHNVRTIDGKNSVHVMAIITFVTPDSSGNTLNCIPRLKQPLSAQLIAEKGQIKVIPLSTKPKSALNDYKVVKLDSEYLFHYKIQLSTYEFAWVYGKFHPDQSFVGWNGYMEGIKKHNHVFAIYK